MTLSLFPKGFKTQPKMLQAATISDFGGGLNVVDNDTTMKSRFAKVLHNIHRSVDGSQMLRWGQAFKYDVSSAVVGDVIELVYFKNHLIAFTSAGEVAKITEDGIVTAIWNLTIANALVGGPDGWSVDLSQGCIDYTEFRGELIVVNGKDKPIIIDSNLAVNYLQDKATGSNVYTPVAKYVTTVSNFCVMAGVLGAPHDLYISSQGTSGVWPGDDAPNDSITLSIGAWVPQNSGEILGIGSFRNFLLVAFEGAIVVVELGAYVNDQHTPKVQDNIVEHGVISHRTMIDTRNNFIMADTLGWHSAIRTQFGLIDTETLSSLVNPQYITTIPNTLAERQKCFTVRDRLQNRVMLFMPSVTGPVNGWGMTSSDDRAIKNVAWNTYNMPAFTCGCASARGRIFLAAGTRIYLQGNSLFTGEDYNADRMFDATAVWATSTVYVAGTILKSGDAYYRVVIGHTSSSIDDDLAANLIEEYLGEAISFEWELPWVDLDARVHKKRIAYIHADTEGSAAFTVEMYADNFIFDEDGERVPALSVEYVAGAAAGYGNPIDQPFGGGRRLRDERPWGMPLDFKIMKLRFIGTTRKALRFITFSILYKRGTFRRQ